MRVAVGGADIRHASSGLFPVLCPVPDVQDFDNFISVTVHNYIGRADEFAGSPHLAGSANAGKGRQLFDAVYYHLCDIPGGGGIVLLDVFNSGFKLVRDFRCPPNLRLTIETGGRCDSAHRCALQTRPGRLARCPFAHPQ
jgi:hypothetical protein